MYNKTEEKERKESFRRNVNLEELIRSLNSSLQAAEENLLDSVSDLSPDYPLIFIMGPLRSGTTLFTQWLAKSGIVAYPTNLLSRFYGAPGIGAQIQLMLTDPRFNFRNEILDFNSEVLFESDNGKTRGALAPNEFWYFWRRFLPFGDLDWLSDDELFRVVDQEMLVRELTSLTRIFDKPFALKAMILNYNIPFLNKIFKKAIFVQIKRDPVTNVASILDARKRQLGSEKEWYSFKIPEYNSLKDMDPVSQAAGQLFYINDAVDKGISSVSSERKLIVKYEDFCANPRRFFFALVDKIYGDQASVEYVGPEHFSVSREEPAGRRKKIEKALLTFER